MTQTFTIKNKKIEIFFALDGHIELYEKEDPRDTGFIFSDDKELFSFINGLTDIAEKHQKE